MDGTGWAYKNESPKHYWFDLFPVKKSVLYTIIYARGYVVPVWLWLNQQLLEVHVSY